MNHEIIEFKENFHRFLNFNHYNYQVSKESLKPLQN